MNAALIVAEKEFRDGLRNRWVLAITLVLALLAMGISYFGAAASGGVGFTSLSTTIVSLSTLAVFLIPLIALLLAYDAIVGEEEQGTLLLLLTYPLGRGQLLAGKFLGHAAILSVATLLGFGAAGLLIGVFSEQVETTELLPAYGFFLISSVLLGWVFIAFAYLISVSVGEKAKATGLALIVWFIFVLVFDLGLLGALIASGGAIGEGIFPWLLLLNPTDVFRLANLTGFEAAQAQSGLVSVASEALFQPGLLGVVMLAWVAAPLGLAGWRFSRQR